MNDPNKQWNEADVDKGGLILFSEFSECCALCLCLYKVCWRV